MVGRVLLPGTRAALAGSRELGRLEAVAEKGRAAVAGVDRRSRLPDALDAVLRAPVMTSTVLARGLREVTGRKHFRTFAV